MQVSHVTMNDEEETVSEVMRLQREDTEVGQMLRFVEEGVVPDDARVRNLVQRERDRFVVLERVLHYVDPGRRDQVRLVVPEVLRKQIMEEVHAGSFAGHFAVKGLLTKRYWWRNVW